MLDNSPDQDEELKQEIAYKSNINLKKANVELDFEDWQIREIKKCSQDINYFAENYVKVVHPDHGFTSFKPYDYQEEFLGILKNNTRVVANQARQSGKCAEKDTRINIRNKNTGEIMNVSIEEFYELCGNE